MANGRLRTEWTQTSQILAVLINANRDPKKPPVSAESLNPFAVREERKKKPVQYVSIGTLAKALTKSKKS